MLLNGAAHFTGNADVLAIETRDGWVENIYPGWMVLSRGDGTILRQTAGGESIRTFFRSAAKPFQAIPLMACMDEAALPQAALALACASHTASREHLHWVQHLLTLGGFTPEDLQCGPHAPLDPETAEFLRQSGKEPERVHNNCSGKHAGMLLACKKNQWDYTRYLAFDHPLQQEILKRIRQFGNVEEEIPRAVDGCGAPIFYLPVRVMASLYAQLGTNSELARIADAMRQHPTLVGGDGRIDTLIMQRSQGKLLAKVGADGVLGVSRIGADEGFAIKIADGNATVRNAVTLTALQSLGWLPEIKEGEPLYEHWKSVRTNTRQQIIGQLVSVTESAFFKAPG